MKSSVLFAATLCACIAATARAAPEIYSIEPMHTYPSIEAPHLGISYWRGKFTKTSGKIWLDREAQTGRVDITIDTTSVTFGSMLMDRGVRGEDWFNVEKYPTAKYVSDSITFRAGVPTSINGQLTLRGITRPVRLDILEFNCIQSTLYKREECGADARAEFDRRDFGMVQQIDNGNGKVRLQIQVEALKGDFEPGPPPGFVAPPGGPPGAPPAGAPPK
jgi:polyisoprenoid-binding protein YceI